MRLRNTPSRAALSSGWPLKVVVVVVVVLEDVLVGGSARSSGGRVVRVRREQEANEVETLLEGQAPSRRLPRSVRIKLATSESHAIGKHWKQLFCLQQSTGGGLELRCGAAPPHFNRVTRVG